MTYTLTHKIETTSIQKATALRDKCAEWLAEDPDVKVVNTQVGTDHRRFKVAGVDVAGKQPFVEHVEAETEQQARDKVATSTKIVAEVTVE